MNWFDCVIATVILASMIAGVKHGFARTAIGFGTFIVALFCGLWFYGIPGAAIGEYIGSPQVANLLGFLAIFIGVGILGSILAFFVDKALKAAKLSWLNRIFGLLFGVVRGTLICAVLVLGAMAFPGKEPPKAVANSAFAPYVIDTARVLVAVAPREVKDAFANSYERIKKIWAEALSKGIKRIPEQTN